MTADPDTARERLAAEAERLAAETGDPRFTAAAGMLRGGRAGRPPVDDADALALAQSMLASGLAKSKRNACHRAAVLLASRRCEVFTMRSRLARKLKRN